MSLLALREYFLETNWICQCNRDTSKFCKDYFSRRFTI